MLQAHHQLITICEEYNSLFSINEFYPIQKAYTTPHFLVFIVRFPGKTIALYIGRGNQYQGVFISEKIPPSYLRVQDRLLDYARKYLVGARIGKMSLESTSYVFSFTFKNEHPENLILFGYKDRQLFFSKKSKDEVYLSWSGETIISNDLLQIVQQFGADKINESEKSGEKGIASYLEAEEKKVGGMPIQKKKEKFLVRKIANITNDLEMVSKWAFLQDDLTNDRINLNVDELSLYGQKIKLQSAGSLWLRRDIVFKKIKKLKKAEDILKTRLADSINEYESVKSGKFDFEVTKEKVIQPLWITHSKQKKTTTQNFNIKNFAIRNIAGVIGLDAKSNDWIRSEAHKDHWWFHIENYTGAHCIIKTDDFTILSVDELGLIASMLRDFSKLEITEIPLIYGQVKNVKGVKGAQGMVLVKKPKYLRCLYTKWKEIISII